MFYIFNKNLFTFFLLSFGYMNSEEVAFVDQKKLLMIQDLEVIKHHFEMGYAPAKWKKEYLNWDLNQSFEKAKNQILQTPAISTKQFHQIVRQFMNSMSDYHVSVLFFSTESASLPFSVKGVNGRYFIDWIDPIRLPKSYYGLSTGDEILMFDERPVGDVIDEIEKEGSKSSHPQTDRALAEMKLTVRSGKNGDTVPKGVILIKTRSKETQKMSQHQLKWNYTPEHIKNRFDFITFLDSLSWLNFNEKETPKIQGFKLMMASPAHQEFAKEYAARDGSLGSRKSFLPPFGEILWSNHPQVADEEGKEEGQKIERNEDAKCWHAYIFRNSEERSIGYIRIPHYLLTLGQTEEFGKIITAMEKVTDGLIIDQVDNFGGFVHIQYMLASMLTNYPLQAPLHRVRITQKDVMNAYEALQLIQMIEKSLDSIDSEASELEENQGEEVSFNFQELLFLKAYFELILEEWNSGKNMTTPTPILGVDKINPHPIYRYTKPIMMLINELDFSGGDFMPAIMQDNQRALLFGSRTAGAGGYVFSFEFPNTNGIASCSYTASIAERMNADKIENLGISPDVPYQITLQDLQGGYQGYIESANQTMNGLIENSTEL